MAFYSPTDSRFTRHHLEEMELSFSAMDCILMGERGIYASTELTSGFRVYQACRDASVRTTDEVKKKMGADWYRRHIWDANVALALQFAGAIRKEQEGRIVITPAPFMAPGWSQFEYLAFWETLLRTRVDASWFNENWQYSNGCTFEFAVAHDAGVPTYDKDGKTIDLDAGIRLVRLAVQSIESDGFDTRTLRQNLDRLIALREASARVG